MLYVFLADGFEEIEAITPYDFLKRCGVDVHMVGVGGKEICGAHHVRVCCDMEIDEVLCDQLEGIILPGGMPGTNNLYNNKKLREFVEYCSENKLLIGAICAAPSILGKMGLLKGKKAVCYPDYENTLIGASIVERKTVVDGNMITAKGAGVAMEFGFEIGKYLVGQDIAQNVLEQMQWKQKI